MVAETLLTVMVACNNLNFVDSPRCNEPVDYFVVNKDGSSWGFLKNGIQFTQRNVSNELGIRLQRLQLEDAFWYVTDKGDIHANSDIEALSKYLAK